MTTLQTKRLITSGVSSLAFLVVLPAQANLVQNGGFESIGANTANFNLSTASTLPNWYASNPSTNLLDCVVVAGATNGLCGSAFGGGFTFWTNPGASPAGGNYFGMDGDSGFNSSINQNITGLVSGMSYFLSFYQAAAQQNGFNGATTDQWQVTLAGQGGSQTLTSALMSAPNHGDVNWMSQTLVFTATSAQETLSFLNLGTPAGEPPFALLDGISLTATPEPGTLVLLGLGLLAVPILHRMRK